MAAFDRAQGDAERALHSRAGDKIARIGIATRGVLWAVVGALATKLAIGDGGKAIGTQEAVDQVGKSGRIPLFALAIGLAAYAAWRFVEAVADEAGGHGKWKRIAHRIGCAGSGVVHLALAVLAAEIAIGLKSGGHDRTHDITAKLLHVPFGRVLVVVYAAIAIGTGVVNLVQGFRAPFRRDFDSSLSQRWAKIATALGRFGSFARAVAFGLIGWFLLRAAWHVDENEAKGLGAALLTLREAPMGTVVFAIVAVGLLSYAVFCLVYAPCARTHE